MRIEGERHFLGGLETTRVGRIIGPDDTQKVIEVLARTCHIRFGSVKVGGKGKASPKGALNYNRRAGKYGPLKDGKLDELERKLAEARTTRDEAARAGADDLDPHAKEIAQQERTLEKARDRDAKAAELECEAGDHEAVLRAADLITAGAGPRVDRFAERLLISQVAELPADSTPGQRKACAEALVKRWTDAGHPAHAAVHGNGCVQPHVHVLATARPIRRDGNGVEYADRSVRLWAGQHAKEAVQGERGLVVEIVNRTCPSEVLFHHGRHEDVGIDREAREAAGLLQRRLGRGATHRPESYAVKPGFDEERPRRQAKRYALERDARRAAEAAAEKRKAERHRERVAKAAERAAERAGNAARHLAGIEAGSLEAPPPVPLKERQREAMQGAIERGGKEVDLESGEGQALGFALLNLERARRREKEARKRKEVLEKAGRDAAVAERHDAEKDEPDAARKRAESDPAEPPGPMPAPVPTKQPDPAQRKLPGEDAARLRAKAAHAELSAALRPAFGDRAGQQADALVRDIEAGHAPGLLVREAGGEVNVLARVYDSDGAQRLLERLLTARGRAAEGEWRAADLRRAGRPGDERRAGLAERNAGRDRELEAKHRGALVHALEPAFGAAAGAAADELVDGAGKGGAFVLRRREDGTVEALPGAVDGRGAQIALAQTLPGSAQVDEQAQLRRADQDRTPAPGAGRELNEAEAERGEPNRDGRETGEAGEIDGGGAGPGRGAADGDRRGGESGGGRAAAGTTGTAGPTGTVDVAEDSGIVHGGGEDTAKDEEARHATAGTVRDGDKARAAASRDAGTAEERRDAGEPEGSLAGVAEAAGVGRQETTPEPQQTRAGLEAETESGSRPAPVEPGASPSPAAAEKTARQVSEAAPAPPAPLPGDQLEREAGMRRNYTRTASLRGTREKESRSGILSPDATRHAAEDAVELTGWLADLQAEMETSRGAKDPYALHTLAGLGAEWRKQGGLLEAAESAGDKARAAGERTAIRREAALRGGDIEDLSQKQEEAQKARAAAQQRDQGR